MPRSFREHVDEEILEGAASLFAQHGFAQTSLQAVADAVGLSKAGLLHHFPTKDALFTAAQDVVRVQSERVHGMVADLPPGQARDRRALELLVDIALDRPGLVALALGPLSHPDTSDPKTGDIAGDGGRIFEIFALDPQTGDPERLVRVMGALSALAVLSLAANRAGERTGWRPHIVATCLDALGYHHAARPETEHGKA
ncbi:TetR/AcrR family transcriptional regulator [Amycolatopsis suaedae]|uniref:TetR/AcrR family transcriptional regulator n=1 Tax=Amycolatopsis suaedae TaxID=2510978 RepID=A0A4V2ELQ8_9PSEU|nr:TetR/AcrR family transcriptional regulator [Amycolatopsis suaedae]RZQ62415.1 TetR/AcrR family transcriptional regulator [Amycolatopsis suaedae]